MKLLLSVKKKVVYVQFVSSDPEIHCDMPPVAVRKGRNYLGIPYGDLLKAARKAAESSVAPVEFPDPPQPAEAKKT